MQSMWKTLTGRPIGDVVDFVRDHARDGQVVHLGTDSLQRARHTRFVTVVAILTPGRGGRAIWTRAVSPRIASLRERLLREVWLSVELGLRLHPVVPGPAVRSPRSARRIPRTGSDEGGCRQPTGLGTPVASSRVEHPFAIGELQVRILRFKP